MKLPTELTTARYVSFTTFRKSGKAVSTPVWAADDQSSFYIFSESNAGKMKRLRNSGKSQLAPCTVLGKVTGPSFDCDAQILNDADDIKQAYDALQRKYGWQMSITNIASKLTGRYDQRALIRVSVV